MHRRSVPGVFVCGRQHSGNTMFTLLIGRLENCVSSKEEDIFWEHWPQLNRMSSAVERAEWISQHLNLDDPDLEPQVASDLAGWAQDHPDADALSVFQKSMVAAVRDAGDEFWVRKATSYIFHANKILRLMPNVKLVYMLRNPFDLCASKKRRDPGGENIVGTTISWNCGVRIADRCRRKYPGRFHIVCYERLAQDPEQTVRELCQFLHQPYEPSLLNVPHINPSENAYQLVPGSMGINRSRVHYYLDVLKEEEIAAVRMLCSGPLLRRYYPSLARVHPARLSPKVRATMLVGRGCFEYPRQVLRHIRKFDMPLSAYLFRRAGALLKSA